MGLCVADLSGGCRFGEDCRKEHVQGTEREKALAKFKSKDCEYGENCKTKNCLFGHAGDEAKKAAVPSPASESAAPAAPREVAQDATKAAPVNDLQARLDKIAMQAKQRNPNGFRQVPWEQLQSSDEPPRSEEIDSFSASNLSSTSAPKPSHAGGNSQPNPYQYNGQDYSWQQRHHTQQQQFIYMQQQQQQYMQQMQQHHQQQQQGHYYPAADQGNNLQK